MHRKNIDLIIDNAIMEIAAAPEPAPAPVQPADGAIPDAEPVDTPGDEEFDVEADAAEPAEDEFPKPRYSIQNAVDTIQGLIDNWQEVRLNFPPGDERREEVTEYGDVLNGLKLNLEKLSQGTTSENN